MTWRERYLSVPTGVSGARGEVLGILRDARLLGVGKGSRRKGAASERGRRRCILLQEDARVSERDHRQHGGEGDEHVVELHGSGLWGAAGDERD